MSSLLTEAQKELIERKRLEALEKRKAAASKDQNNNATKVSRPNSPPQPIPTTTPATTSATTTVPASNGPVINKELIDRKKAEALERRRLKEQQARVNHTSDASNPTNRVIKPQRASPRPSTFSAPYKKWSPNTFRQGPQKSLPNSTKVLQKKTSSNEPKPVTPFEQMKKCTMSIALNGADRLDLTFDYNIKVIDAVRQLKTASYNQSKRAWTIDLSDYENALQMIRQLRTKDVDISLREDFIPGRIVSILLKERQLRQNRPDFDLKERLSREMVNNLFDFQKEGIKFGIAKEGRLLFADDMGLGKTVQALGLAEWYKDDWPLLIVCPATVVGAWKEAISKWLPEVSNSELQVVNKSRFEKSKVYLMSYDRLNNAVDDLIRYGTNVVIFDESHLIKNDETQRCRAATRLGKEVRRLILLSGTPALSRPIELFTQITLLNPKLFPNKHEFGVRYCNGHMKFMPHAKKSVWDYRGYSNTDELKIVLESTVMIRRLKATVLDNLPPKTRTLINLKVDTDEEDKDQKELITYYSEKFNGAFKGGRGKEALIEWYGESAKYKVPAIKKYIRKAVEKGEKFLCFAYHSVIFDALSDMLNEMNVSHVRIDGQTLTKYRQDACNYFQNNERCKVALVSIVAAGVGITLTAANYVIFTELYWNPGMITQAEDRAHRLGQTRPVLVEYLVVENTVDSWIWASLGRKLKVLNLFGVSKDKMTAGSRQAEQLRIDDLFKKMIKETEEFNDPKELEILDNDEIVID